MIFSARICRMNRFGTVLVFGTFDLLHEGHKYFLREAKKLGGKLVVAVAPDSVVLTLKGSKPKISADMRVKNLKASFEADEVLIGDESLNSWRIVRKTSPDIIALGYDQKELKRDLEKYAREEKIAVEFRVLLPYGDGSLHSSGLRDGESKLR